MKSVMLPIERHDVWLGKMTGTMSGRRGKNTDVLYMYVFIYGPCTLPDYKQYLER